MRFGTFAQFANPFNEARRINISTINPDADVRFRQMRDWLAEVTGQAAGMPQPASADASFRRYFRLPGKKSTIVMDAPPSEEDCRTFIKVAGYLEAMGLNSPRVLQADLENGFLLLTDLGSTQYLDVFRETPEQADALYQDAIEALLVLQAKGSVYRNRLPAYDERLLYTEMQLFFDWLCRQLLALRFSAAEEAAWQDCCHALIENALQQESVFVHRDFHSRNLMRTKSQNPGILDFQDAVAGPMTYDLVSLLKDCYICWPKEKILRWALAFYARQPEQFTDAVGTAEFIRHFDLMGVQRHLKAAGIFARLLQRDGKPGYIKDIPRTLGYISDIAGEYECLEFLGSLIEKRVLPALAKVSQ